MTSMITSSSSVSSKSTNFFPACKITQYTDNPVWFDCAEALKRILNWTQMLSLFMVIHLRSYNENIVFGTIEIEMLLAFSTIVISCFILKKRTIWWKFYQHFTKALPAAFLYFRFKFFHLWGKKNGVKAALKMLVKLSPLKTKSAKKRSWTNVETTKTKTTTITTTTF